MLSICKFLDRSCPLHPIGRIGIDNPDKGVLIHMCCTYSGYHAVISHVKLNHGAFATDCQRLKLSTRSIQKTWSVFADAFSSSAHEFGICTPKFSLVAIINWHLNYEGPKCIEFTDGSGQVLDGQNHTTEPSVLAVGLAGLDLNHSIVVLDPVELDTVIPGFEATYNVSSGSSIKTQLVGECMQAVEVCNIQCDGGHTQVAPPTEHNVFLTP